MKKIHMTDIPKDYHYYRSHTKVFLKYLTEKESPWATPISEDGNCWYVRHFFWWLFSIAWFEKSDIRPTREFLLKYGMKRGLVFWSGFHNEKPSGRYWIPFWYLFSKSFHHSTRSAFSVLESEEYWKKWQPNARNHRNKIQKYILDGKIYIDTNASWEDFRKIYKQTKIPHGYKWYLIWRQEFFQKNAPEDFRIFLAYIDGVPQAGAIFLDDHPTSTYLIAFQNPDAKKYHLGLAIIDRWFLDSQKWGYKYMDFDHMKDILDPISYAGYTRFKSEIADYDVKFWRFWMKIFL